MPAKPNNSVEGVLFDWDGTLVIPTTPNTSAYLAMFKEMGIPWGLRELENNYSPNWYQVYSRRRVARKHWDTRTALWRAHYANHRPKWSPVRAGVLAK